MIPVAVTPAGPLVTTMAPYAYGGLYNGWGRYGWGPNYGVGWGGSWYNPYGYMSGTYW